ncbi:NAD(P)/FAD-dependent oxidoreductase [Puniceicoccaceae bacterium K14]|nr:NAD(P)/FAD-dependent oxidoreductase [Puniceicoccaceae bacterium K14]
MPTKHVAVIGGGAAGFFSAITCAEAYPDAQVTIFEKSPKVLSKVRISGGGRCNVTHSCFDPKELATKYPRGSRELRGAFHKWQPLDTINWFQEKGVELKTEEDGRMFPTTDDSQTIIHCLLSSAQKCGIIVRTKTSVKTANRTNRNGFSITDSNNEEYDVTHLIIATGGTASPQKSIAVQLGHTLTQLAPSLFTFNIKDPLIDGLAGLSVSSAQTLFPPTKLKQSGPMLITHWGLSGPAILKLSAWGARDFADRDYAFSFNVNWLGGEMSFERVKELMIQTKKLSSKKLTTTLSPFDLPKRFWLRLLDICSIPSKQWAQVSNTEINAIANKITRSEFRTDGKSVNKDEFVTCGGVSLKEINFKTMQSKLIPNLYFAGEALDIDGITGGFNFQAAWTTGRIAGLSCLAE